MYSAGLRVEVVGGEEEFERDVRVDGELGGLRSAVHVLVFEVKVLNHLLKDGRRDLTERDLLFPLLREVTCLLPTRHRETSRDIDRHRETSRDIEKVRRSESREVERVV